MDKEFEDKIKTVLYGRPPINFLPQNDDDTTYIEVTHVEPGLGNIPVRAHTTVTATTSDDTATTSIAVTSQISTTASGNTIQTVTAATSSNPDGNNTPTTISSNADSIITLENEHYMLPLNRKCFVQIRRLTNEDIQMYKPLPKPLSESSSEDTEDDSESLLTGMTLRKRTTDSTPVRHARAAKKNVNYKGQDESGSDESTEPEKKASNFRPRSGPSGYRLRALCASKKKKHIGASHGCSEPEPSKATDDDYNGDAESNADDKNPKPAPKGKLVTTTHGIKIAKRKRCFKCISCASTFETVSEYNHHYSQSHPMLACTNCGRYFNNPSSLHRHTYVHTKVEGVFLCTRCDKVFPFESQLKSHMYLHRKVSHFPCTYCKRAFKREADRDAHELNHTGPVLKCQNCKYETRDKRYLKQHVRVHSAELKYKCVTCGKGFRFFQQKKRHEAKKQCTDEKDSDEF